MHHAARWAYARNLCRQHLTDIIILVQYMNLIPGNTDKNFFYSNPIWFLRFVPGVLITYTPLSSDSYLWYAHVTSKDQHICTRVDIYGINVSKVFGGQAQFYYEFTVDRTNHLCRE